MYELRIGWRYLYRGQQSHRARIGLALSLLLATPIAAEDRLSPFEKQERFDYEQCANQCQVTLDQRMYSCMPFRKDKRTKQPEDCAEVAYEIYNECVNYCPVDPRLRRRLSDRG